MSAILRTTVTRSICRSSPLLLRSAAESSLRTSQKQYFAPFARCAQIHSGRVEQDSLTSTQQDKATTGSEGLHQEDIAGRKKDLIDSEKTGTATAIHGDWVLFHPVYTPEELKAVEESCAHEIVLHRQPQTLSDKVAFTLVRILRWGFDLVSGYKHKPLPPDGNNMSLDELRRGGYVLTEKAWLRRLLFLETIAGVPGMVAAMLRHLESLRSMRRDSGWIHTLLEDAENERMHLMTFMTLKQPSIWFRAMVLGAQGVFSNIFFFSYLISPKTCHRFVGHLEEEAVLTYTRCIEDIESGRLPEWKDMPAPKISKDYWRLPDDATLLDVIYAVRSDESTHRFINHSFANLNPKTDVSPFALREPDMHIKGKKLGFERTEAEQYVADSHKLIHQSQAGSAKK